MALNQNQFLMTTVQGELDLRIPGGTLACELDPNYSGAAVVPGQALKLVNTNPGGIPKVTPITSNTDRIFGFVDRNLKDISYIAGSSMEVAIFGSVMYMTTNAAIARGQHVEFDFNTTTVIPSAGVNPICGQCFDSASASGQLVRIFILTQVQFETFNSYRTTLTLAQINAGGVANAIVPGFSGKQLSVTSFILRVTGAFTTGTSISLVDSAGINVATIAEAALTNGAVLTPNSSNVTLGAGFGSLLTSGSGLWILNNGSAQAGGTNIAFTITSDLV